ncbi:hypothetical protein IWQ60_007124 [Tieghemiomyces parasiticus]|uniref:Uncharacterized protein n=1 Tax=Tieghemiomyces parasiticus TaxID=78921 RepID=A0A9W8A7N0_9FUNG|nr:hypothetical protein IWQ60_007124 [Tieghemiomyces parasiticus]
MASLSTLWRSAFPTVVVRASLRNYLTHPTWSVATLLPNHVTQSPTEPIDQATVQHLHRLANLELPTDAAAVEALRISINELNHFVSHVKELDLSDVEPLVTLTPERVIDVLDITNVSHLVANPSFITPRARSPLLDYSEQVIDDYYVIQQPAGSDQIET